MNLNIKGVRGALSSPLIILGAAICLFIGCSKGGNGKLVISGNIEFVEVNIAFKVTGRLVELNVEEGDYVKNGYMIASLDQQELINELNRAKAALKASDSQVAKLEKAILLKEANIKGQIDLRRAELNQAKAMLKELESGSRIQEIGKAKAAANRAHTEYEQAKRDWERAESLYKNKDISPSQYERFKTILQTSQSSLKQAEEHLALLIEGPRSEDIEAAISQVERAKAALRIAEAQDLEAMIKRDELAMAQADVERLRAEVAIAETRLKDSVVLSPIDGIVLVKSAEEGEVLAAGTPVATIGDINHPWLRGYINEPYLDRVKLKSRVKLKTDSGKTFWGNVSYISSEAEFTPKQIQTKEERVKLVYRIKVDVENPEGELKLNMPLEAEILLD